MWTLAIMLTIIVILLACILYSYARYAGERGANVALSHVLHEAQTERVRFLEAYQWRAEAAANRQREDEERQRQAEPAAMAIFQPLPARNSFRSSTNPFARASLFSPMAGRKTEEPRPEVKEPAVNLEVVADIHREQEIGQPQPAAASKEEIFEPRPEEASCPEDAPVTSSQDAKPVGCQDAKPVAYQEAPQRGKEAAKVTGKPPLPSKLHLATGLMGIHSLGRRLKLKRQAPPPPIRQESLASLTKGSVAPNEASVGEPAKAPVQIAIPETKIAIPEAKIAKPENKIANWDPRYTLALSPLKRTWSMPMAFIDKCQMDECLV